MFSQIKKFYKGDLDNNSLDVEVVSNEVHIGKLSLNKIDPKWHQFFNFLFDDSASTIIHGNIYNTLEYHYGRCDFKFDGNREYRNWIVENDGVYFIASSKNEYVIPSYPQIKKNLPNALISFYYELFKLTVDYLDNNEHSMPIDKLLIQWRKKKIVIGNEHHSLRTKGKK